MIIKYKIHLNDLNYNYMLNIICIYKKQINYLKIRIIYTFILKYTPLGIIK